MRACIRALSTRSQRLADRALSDPRAREGCATRCYHPVADDAGHDSTNLPYELIANDGDPTSHYQLRSLEWQVKNVPELLSSTANRLLCSEDGAAVKGRDLEEFGIYIAMRYIVLPRGLLLPSDIVIRYLMAARLNLGERGLNQWANGKGSTSFWIWPDRCETRSPARCIPLHNGLTRT